MPETLPQADNLTEDVTLESPTEETEPGTQVETSEEVIDRKTYDKTVKGFQRKIAQLQEESSRSVEQNQKLQQYEQQLRQIRYQNYPEDQAAQYKVQELEQENIALRAQMEAAQAVKRYYSALTDFEDEFPEAAKFARELADEGDYMNVQTLEQLAQKLGKLQLRLVPSNETASTKRAVTPSNPALPAHQEELSDEEFAKLPLAEQRKRLGVADLPY